MLTDVKYTLLNGNPLPPYRSYDYRINAADQHGVMFLDHGRSLSKALRLMGYSMADADLLISQCGAEDLAFITALGDLCHSVDNAPQVIAHEMISTFIAHCKGCPILQGTAVVERIETALRNRLVLSAVGRARKQRERKG